ncbi:MAG: SDR family NAD(P)-dependent oxidoreductase, partial [Pseudomonadota bacterium]
MDLQLDGKTALVTGASAGIGRAACALFAAEGVRLAIAGRRIEALEETGDLVEAAGGARPHILQGDLGDREQAAEIARRALAAFDGRVDILLNNAGASVPLDDPWDEEAWERSQRLNFDAARHVARVIAPAMQANGWGRIVNLTGAMVAPAPNAAAPAKAALQSWSRSLSLQLAPHGVTVNTIAPGRIATEQIRNK